MKTFEFAVTVEADTDREVDTDALETAISVALSNELDWFFDGADVDVDVREQ